ncbi:Galectin [Caenorhabditis elegans]|uniref:Galectin n=1 Tax=Caenorhabditis elegans TaxID=6239 RepID=O01329_CAEEL|nr:Galectin [Caenorhabditis elegans]CAB04389.1 Galectin [Caenorhabditis elegans]|eukprot:NP_492885.1 Galectin [Caenorhabditis elegans]
MRLVFLLLTFLVLVSGYFSDNDRKKVKKISIVHYDSTSSSSSEEHRYRPRGGKRPKFDDDSSDDYSGRRGGGRQRPPRPPRPAPTPKPREDWITINGPFTTTLPIPGGYWDTGKIMRIYGIPGSGRWTINLAKSQTWVFHFACEPTKGLVARTRHTNGAWEVGETYSENPFQANTQFNVTMVNQPTHIEIHVNGAFFVNFNHRVPNPSRDYQGIDFQFVAISKVEFSR